MRTCDFYAGKKVLLTGGTGFLGKVLIEKLLRSCPHVAKIYLVVRGSKGQTPQQRWDALTELPVFDRLKKEQPGALEEKVVVVEGDVMQLGLGLSSETRDLLVQQVEVVVHSAASVRFDDPLPYALLMNTRGTREVARLALDLRRLQVFCYVSTAYSNCHQPVIAEGLMPAPADWRQMVRLAEERPDDRLVRVLTPKLLGAFPNTYTFSKALAEHVVQDTLAGRVPTVILRPTIVVPALSEPVPGWLDSFNGPVALMVGIGKGLVRVAYTDPNKLSDYMPVDVVAKAILLAISVEEARTGGRELTVYNAAANNIMVLKNAETAQIGMVATQATPVNDIIWTPRISLTNSRIWFFVGTLLFHMLPAALLDTALWLSGRKTRLCRLQRRIYVTNGILSYFTTREWLFENDTFIKLFDELDPEEAATWGYTLNKENLTEVFSEAIKGARVFLLNEAESSLPQARRHARRMKIMDQIARAMFWAMCVWLVVSCSPVQRCASTLAGYFGGLTMY